MWIFLLWWCVDDHIAEALGAPGVGALPVWVPLLIGVAFSFTFSASLNKDRRR